MSNFQCTQPNCFYRVKGRCTSITALGGDNCAQFRTEALIRQRVLPRRADLAVIRKHLDLAYQASIHTHVKAA